MKTSKNQAPVLFYDSDCGLCDRSVAFLLRSRHAARLRYAPQNGTTFQQFLAEHPEAAGEDSVIVWLADEGRYMTMSSGMVFALKRLGGFRAVLGILLGIFPKPVADTIYKWIARQRRRLFPNKELCSILSAEKRALILP